MPALFPICATALMVVTSNVHYAANGATWLTNQQVTCIASISEFDNMAASRYQRRALRTRDGKFLFAKGGLSEKDACPCIDPTTLNKRNCGAKK